MTNDHKHRGKSRATRELEVAILGIVRERAPITVRGIGYALFTRDLIDGMTTANTQRISRIATRMRETGALDWTLIVDGSRAVDRVSLWRDPSEIIAAAVRGYRRDSWQDQPTLVEVWSEKATIQGVLEPVLNEFGVTFRVMKGFGSFTALRQAAEDSLDLPEGREGVVLYLGDWDPSGLYMSDVDIPARLERYGSRWRLERIALVRGDTKDLPSFDAATKAGDARHKWFVERYGYRCWELDAMDPNDLRERVTKQISSRLNLLAWERAKEVEAAQVDSMRDFHAAWQRSTRGGLPC